jgi:hypothetical protein
MRAGGADDAIHKEFSGSAAVSGAAVGNSELKEEKVFFSKEKKQKTFISSALPRYGTWPDRAAHAVGWVSEASPITPTAHTAP